MHYGGWSGNSKAPTKMVKAVDRLASQEPVMFNDTIRSNIAYGMGGNAAEPQILSTSELPTSQVH